MGKIRVLSDQLINQIAAGEIVERPASVVKELVENALDAGAVRIDIEVARGGRERITIRDDGEGMSHEDALLAFEHHATSKLRAAEDLERIASLGFRGEALPSVAAVSRLALRTAERNAGGTTGGTLVEIHGGVIRDVRPIAWAGGTELVVRDLFFNVPARKKFLRADTTESAHIARTVTHYALAWPAVHFTLLSGTRRVIDVPPVRSLDERIHQLFGDEFLADMIPVDAQEGDVRLSGFISGPHQRRASTEAQYFFVNGRMVRDRLLATALSQVYRGIIPGGTYPAAILFVAISATEIDVNVHPAKTEIRFRQSWQVQTFIRRTLETAIRAHRPFASLADWTAPAEPTDTPAGDAPTRDSDSAADAVRQRVHEALADFSTRPTPPMERRFAFSSGRTGAPDASMPSTDRRPETAAPPPVPGAAVTDTGRWRVLGQWRESFIVAVSPDELLVVDQHVAHERVLYEAFRRQLAERAVPRQRLLVPETLELSPAHREEMDRVADQFAAAGFEIEPFGSGGTVVIKAVPAMASRVEVELLVRDILDRLGDVGASFSIDEVQRRVAAALACHAAVKIHTPLEPEAMQNLVDRLLAAEEPTTCPHGRPVVLRLHIRDVEKGFKRA
ncbi:MAG TPA: DNA mismatch repair endonuclease MutL [Acidobacteriota bacterium]|nr:DNA mismatch repair endonuclease MutL [Acidobacteriota bacterium]HQM62140.1 DNA mismatch repair endonuclease MutL [Acidobacteriota bacterium]